MHTKNNIIQCLFYYAKDKPIATTAFLPPPPKVNEVMFSPVCLCLFGCVCLFVCRISQKLVDGYGLNLVDRLGV